MEHSCYRSEITALYNIDHAQTLAIVLPGVMRTQKEKKFGKLLHYAKNVWGFNSENDDENVEKAILKTEEFLMKLELKQNYLIITFHAKLLMLFAKI